MKLPTSYLFEESQMKFPRTSVRAWYFKRPNMTSATVELDQLLNYYNS